MGRERKREREREEERDGERKERGRERERKCTRDWMKRARRNCTRERRERCNCGRMIHALFAFQYCSFTDFRLLNPNHETHGYATFSTNFA